MNIFLVFIQLYFYLFWTITNWFMKMFFPIQSTIEQIFPTKLKVNIQNIFIIDLMYQKKIICNKNIKLKDLFKHPSYHAKSFVFIEYNVQNIPKLNGNYILIVRGTDKDSLIRCIQYLEDMNSFYEYFDLENGQNENLIDAQINIIEKKVEVDQTSFMNKLLGIDRKGHKFLYIHHELITLADYWKILCIINGTMHWFNDTVKMNTVDMNLNEKIYGNDDILFLKNE